MVPLPWGFAMKKFTLLTLAAATALCSVTAQASAIAPNDAQAHGFFDYASNFQREERRAERQAERAERGSGDRAERRAERMQNRAPRPEAAPATTAPVERNRFPVERQRDDVQTKHREASQHGRNYDRNGDGNLDHRWDRNRDGRLDQRYDRNRNGEIDRRYERDNDNRLDRNRGGNWSNRWRSDNRYDWRGNRRLHGDYYRQGRYYAPYRGHSYSRISIGFSLGTGFYGARYWINDPWQYRLPAAYGPYRWVRYYDDVLLVDVRSGRVVDVIRDFFW
jgi:hypothetical protein